MAVTRFDISLAARAAGHLYQTTAYLGTLILGGLSAAAQPRFLLFSPHFGDSLVILFLGIGFLSALYYARRELNGWAYVIATVGTVLLVALAGGLEPIREVLESDESDVIPCRALDSLLRSARCGHPNTALRRTAVAFVTPVI